jgi:hypothetical protein
MSNSKETQKREIQSQIEKNGWKIIDIDEYEWWENEVWEIESIWSPIGAKAFVVFVVDPQILIDKSAVWAVLASPKRPLNWQGESTDFTLVFNSKWRDNLPEVINYLLELRNL